MARRSVPSKRLDAAALPHAVDIPVPADGLGQRVNAMVAWCEARGMRHAVRGHEERPAGEAPRTFCRFRFADEAAAAAFRAAWLST